MILVLGATGTVGSETVKSLKAKGASVKAASRNPEKAQAELGVPAVAWDFEQPQLFARAGAVAGEALAGDALIGRSLTLTGSEALTYGEMAAELSEVVGTRIRYVEISPE
jgi:uncharacterized protein YbjT (DUF2867 family)